MLEFFTNPTIIWLTLAVVLLLLEFSIPGVLVIFFSFGAFVVTLLTWIVPISINLQLIIFLSVSVASLVILRRRLTSVFHGKSKREGEAGGVDNDLDDSYVGRIATVTTDITPGTQGRVEMYGSTWSAEAAPGAPAMHSGDRVKIVSRSGLILIVRPVSGDTETVTP